MKTNENEGKPKRIKKPAPPLGNFTTAYDGEWPEKGPVEACWEAGRESVQESSRANHCPGVSWESTG